MIRSVASKAVSSLLNTTSATAANVASGSVRNQTSLHAFKRSEPIAEITCQDPEDWCNTPSATARADAAQSRLINFNQFTPAHVESVLALYLGPYLDIEPLNRAVGLSRREAQSAYVEMLENAASDGLSFVAVDDDQDKIVGAIVNEKQLRGRYRYTSTTSEKMAKIQAFLRFVEGDAFAQLPHSQSLLKIQSAVVKQGYQNNGIGNMLMQMSVNEAIKQKCDYITGIATSPLIQNMLFFKLGFRPIWSCSTMTYAEEESQEMPFQCIAHSSPSVVFMARNLVSQPMEY